MRRAFISYSHDSEDHKNWVRELATFLQKNGIEVILDQWELDFGDDLPAFMERGIRDTDRVLVISTNRYIEKANAGTGGVGYEKTILTAEILNGRADRRKFVPIVRNVKGVEKLPTFFGAAYYADLSGDGDNERNRNALLESLHQVSPKKPSVGASPFLPAAAPRAPIDIGIVEPELSSWRAASGAVAFNNRFTQAFPGVRGVRWFDDTATIVDRLGILLARPLLFREGCLAGWWRGPSNLQIEQFEHIEGSNFLMNVEELNIRRVAAVNPGSYYRTWVYVETTGDQPTGLYDPARVVEYIDLFGYANEEYGLVDDKLPVSRTEYDDGAAIIDGRPVDIRGRAVLRNRFITPYNFLIAPFNSPINNNEFDPDLESYLNRLLQNEDVFDEMADKILRLPRRH